MWIYDFKAWASSLCTISCPNSGWLLNHFPHSQLLSASPRDNFVGMFWSFFEKRNIHLYVEKRVKLRNTKLSLYDSAPFFLLLTKSPIFIVFCYRPLTWGNLCHVISIIYSFFFASTLASIWLCNWFKISSINNSILMHSSLNLVWHFWLSTRFSCCLMMKSVENILGYIRQQFYRFPRGCSVKKNT
jgi:hypothetical protein